MRFHFLHCLRHGNQKLSAEHSCLSWTGHPVFMASNKVKVIGKLHRDQKWVQGYIVHITRLILDHVVLTRLTEFMHLLVYIVDVHYEKYWCRGSIAANQLKQGFWISFFLWSASSRTKSHAANREMTFTSVKCFLVDLKWVFFYMP